MRGKEGQEQVSGRAVGITPACAGKRMLYARAVRRDRDHPRVCGEKTAPRHRLHLAKGSPPRMRGKAPSNVDVPGTYGITPAYAGKSAERGRNAAGNRDHPRVCGEKGWYVGAREYFVGSPPRMRGKAPLLSEAPSECGITPAYAGKSARILKRRTEKRDHPRVCGEKAVCSAVARQRLGSPPRMRGKASCVWIFARLIGITPACAGKSSPSSCCNHLD